VMTSDGGKLRSMALQTFFTKPVDFEHLKA
jgi:hypothetical protein